MKTLEQGDSTARYSAVTGLKGYGPEAKPAVALLTQALKDADRNVHIQAAYALAAIGPDAESALPRLLETLKSTDADVRLAGTYAVPVVGIRSSTALAAIKATLNDRDPRVRAEALVAVTRVGSLEEALGEANDVVYGLTAGIFSEAAISAAMIFSRETGKPFSSRGSVVTGSGMPLGMPVKTRAAVPRIIAPRPIVTMIREITGWLVNRPTTMPLKAMPKTAMPIAANNTAPARPSPRV